MSGLSTWLGLDPASLGAQERFLLLAILLVVTLFVLAVLFAMAVVVLRAAHVRARRRMKALAEEWNACLLDCVGGVVPPEAFHTQVHHGEELEALAFLLQFARRLRGDEARVLAQVAAPYIEHARHALRSRSPEERAFAVQALAAFGMQTQADAVLAALDDSSPYVAMTAAQALGRPEHAPHASLVMHRLWRFSHWSSDHLSAMLAKIGGAAAAPAREILRDPAQPSHARAVAADVLRRLNDVTSSDVAADLLREGSHLEPELAAALLRLLAQVGRGEHIAVVRTTATAPNGMVRAQSMRTITALGGSAETPLLRHALLDESQWVAQEAARGLVRFGRADVLEALITDARPVALIARQALAERGSAAR